MLTKGYLEEEKYLYGFQFQIIAHHWGENEDQDSSGSSVPIHNHEQREMNVSVLLASASTLFSPLLCSSGPPTRNDTVPKSAMPTSTNDLNNLP